MTALPPLKRVQLKQYVASYRESGDGYAVVIVPGLGLSSRFYERSYATFKHAGLRLIVPDIPGTGATPGPQTGVDADMVTAFMIEFIEALGLSRAVFVGHSLGTQSVLLLAMRAPSRVSGIVLVGPTGGDGGYKLVRQVLGLAAEGLRVHPGVIGAVIREYIHVSPARYVGTWIRHRDSVSEGRLSEIDCPALLLHGCRDAVVSHRYAELLRREVRGMTTVEFADATHAMPRSQHMEFNSAVIRFALEVRG